MVVATQPKVERNIYYSSTFVKINHEWQKVLQTGNKHRVFLEGGTTASKTYSEVQLCVLIGANWKQDPLTITIVSESFPHLRTGAMRDFKNIMGESWNDKCWSESKYCYTWPNGCQLEFISGDHPERFSGPRRDIILFNELNNISMYVYREADLRTSKFVMADWNPYGEFWFHDEHMWESPENAFYDKLTYKDVPDIVSKNIMETIESYRDKDPNFYRVHAFGLMGNIEGLVYPKFEQVERLPEGPVLYGLDYGFSSDPTALVKCVIVGDNLYSKEMLYKPGLTNEDIAREMTLLKIGHEPIYADANEPKSAEELRRLGFNVMEVDKAGMRRGYRIQRVNQFNQFWTKDSLNGIKEQRNYRYIEDKERPGSFTEKTTHQWSHLMAAREFALANTGTVGRLGESMSFVFR